MDFFQGNDLNRKALYKFVYQTYKRSDLIILLSIDVNMKTNCILPKKFSHFVLRIANVEKSGKVVSSSF